MISFLLACVFGLNFDLIGQANETSPFLLVAPEPLLNVTACSSGACAIPENAEFRPREMSYPRAAHRVYMVPEPKRGGGLFGIFRGGRKCGRGGCR